jgi:hypothetical protein
MLMVEFMRSLAVVRSSAKDLILLWAYVAADATICGPLVLGDLGFMNKDTGVGTLYIPDALKKTSEFIRETV